MGMMVSKCHQWTLSTAVVLKVGKYKLQNELRLMMQNKLSRNRIASCAELNTVANVNNHVCIVVVRTILSIYMSFNAYQQFKFVESQQQILMWNFCFFE